MVMQCFLREGDSVEESTKHCMSTNTIVLLLLRLCLWVSEVRLNAKELQALTLFKTQFP